MQLFSSIDTKNINKDEFVSIVDNMETIKSEGLKMQVNVPKTKSKVTSAVKRVSR